ncbi:MAG TPA: hypothetical protein DDW90_07580 [Cyanobacteria bacterium UBA9971]|nr:hypothetical protein [Cyanobacteria bacterium UBA9971]
MFRFAQHDNSKINSRLELIIKKEGGRRSADAAIYKDLNFLDCFGQSPRNDNSQLLVFFP